MPDSYRQWDDIISEETPFLIRLVRNAPSKIISFHCVKYEDIIHIGLNFQNILIGKFRNILIGC